MREGTDEIVDRDRTGEERDEEDLVEDLVHEVDTVEIVEVDFDLTIGGRILQAVPVCTLVWLLASKS